MNGIVERFEGDFVVIEIDGVTKDILKALVSDDVQAGDVVEFHHEMWIRDESATKKRSIEIKKLMDSVWED